MTGSFAARCTHRRPLYSAEREARLSITAIRARNLQAAVPIGSEPILVRQPLIDATHRAVLMRSSQVDVRARLWICPFCLSRNPLPPHYKDITANAIPPELHPNNTTIEYRLSRPAPSPPIFLYVVDTCQEEDSLSALKESLVMSLSLLPENALVGLVTFGTMVRCP